MKYKSVKCSLARNKIAIFKTSRAARKKICFTYIILLLQFTPKSALTGTTTLKKNREITTTAAFQFLSSTSNKPDTAAVGILQQIKSYQVVSTTTPNSRVYQKLIWNSTDLQDTYDNNTGMNNFLYTNDTINNFTVSNNQTKGDGLYEVPQSLVIGLSLAYGAISFAGVVGNLLVLWVVAVSQDMQTKTNIFIANLALSDVIIGLFAIPFQFQAALLQRWDLPDIMCGLCPFVQVISVNVSVFTLATIALDRYRAILYPFRAIQISKREFTVTVIGIWCLSIFFAIPQVIDYNVVQIDDGRGGMKDFCAPNYFSHTFRISYTIGLVVVQYFFPLLIISVAYALVAIQLWGHSLPGNKEAIRDINAVRNKKKVVKMLLVVVVNFGVCWLPLQLYNLLQGITTINEYEYINIIWFSFHWLAMSQSCYNPIIYGMCSDKFKQAFRRTLPTFLQNWIKRWEKRATNDNTLEMEMSCINGSRVSTERINLPKSLPKEKAMSLDIGIIPDHAPIQTPTPDFLTCNRITTRTLVTVQYINTYTAVSTM